jgi:hypothetical protein
MPEGFAVAGEGFAAHVGLQLSQPGQEAALEGVGVQAVEDPLEGVVRWGAVGQGQEGGSPVVATLLEGRNLRAVL